MVFSEYRKQRILHHYFARNKAPTIAMLLHGKKPALHVKRCARFSKKVRNKGGHRAKKQLRQAYKITDEVKVFVVEQMQGDDETTAIQLNLLKSRGYNIH